MVKAAARPAFRCDECGLEVGKWVGRCPECQAWGTIGEVGAPRGAGVAAGPVSAPARPISEVPADGATHRPTGMPELDRVLGGGLVPGSVVLLAGEPGVGKSTLLVTAAARIAQGGRRCLVVTGEESAAQVRLRAGRIDALADELYLAAETDLAAVLGHLDAVHPEVLVVDSVQTIGTTTVDGTSGGVAQVREVAAVLTRVAKERGIATVLVGHVTKEGSIAGPRVLEHLVDVVLHFEGDRHSRLRLVRTVKNRYGPADEVGCFDLTDGGIVGLPDPSGLFLSRVSDPVPGTCVTVAMEGRRALVTEVQALVAATNTPTPRRATSGLDAARVAMVLAVVERRGQLPLGSREVYASTVGGVRLVEPAADLAIALAVAGAARDRPLPGDLVAIGEVSLSGEIRPVGAMVARLQEATRLGFRRALVPVGTSATIEGMRLIEVADLDAALMVLNNSVSTPRPTNAVRLEVVR
ncbi:MAG TPA: DNA repair protein RadA [Mycobacteriales bacterium]|nr:DNA repair protein RadA [Mycobacteriales bacterium]